MKKENLFSATAVAAAFYLFFMWGVLTVQWKIFPYKHIENTLIGLTVFHTDYDDLEKMFETKKFHKHSYPAFEQNLGLTNSSEEAYPGYTLYSNSADHIIRLVDIDGQEVYSWDVNPFTKLERPDHVQKDIPPEGMTVRDVHLYKNGDVLAVYEAVNQFHNNYGAARFDKKGHPLWFHQGRNHHYIDIAPNGDIYTLSLDLEKGYMPYEGMKHLGRPSLHEYIEVISPDGALKKRVSIFEAIRNSEEADLVLSSIWPKGKKGDHLHPNSAHYITKEAAQDTSFEEGQVIVSIRSIDALFVIDLEQESLVSTIRGLWKGQHDPKLLKGGNILMFDNLGARKYSRVFEYNVNNQSYRTIYAGRDDQPFFSPFCSSIERLPNGNTLINSHYNGRIFEVNSNQEIVWDFFIPVRNPKNQKETASVYSAQRFPIDYLQFLD